MHQLETVQKANGAMVRVIDLLARASRRSSTPAPTSPPPGALAVVVPRRVVLLRRPRRRRRAPTRRSSTTSTSTSRRAARSAWSAARAAARRRSPGCCCASSRPPTARCRWAGSRSARSRWTSCAAAWPLVPQEVELFEGTIRENVTLFDPAPADAAVEDALRRVGLDALVSSGIHRALGAAGAGLSAGEAQLLALARVWLRQPDLVVLDEATARIDPITEQRLEAAVADLHRRPHDADHRPQAVDAADGRRGHRVRPRPRRRARRPRGARRARAAAVTATCSSWRSKSDATCREAMQA